MQALDIFGRSPSDGSPGGVLSAKRAYRRRKVINLMVVLGAAIYLFFAALYTLLDFRAYGLAIAINLAMVPLLAVNLFLNRFPGIWAGLWFFFVVIISMLAFTFLLGHASGSHLFLVLIAMLSPLFLGQRSLLLPIAAAVLAWAAFVVAATELPEGPSIIPMSLVESQSLFYFTSALVMVCLFVTSRYAMRLADTAEAALDLEYQRSEKLLRNMLPAPVTIRLKAGEEVADDYSEISVLFADIVGFTSAAQRAGPATTVAMLNRFFTAADQLAERHGCEKIKTIGDCVMVAAGLPEPRDDHAAALGRYALGLRSILSEVTFAGEPLLLRIGIHSGPGVAGVIGLRMGAIRGMVR